MLCNIKPVPFHESDKHIFAKIPGGVWTPGPPLWIRPCNLYIKRENLYNKPNYRITFAQLFSFLSENFHYNQACAAEYLYAHSRIWCFCFLNGRCTRHVFTIIMNSSMAKPFNSLPNDKILE